MLSSLRNRSVAFVAAFASFLTARAFAGESHYNHYAVGERAGGMGGAFTALADEATGAYYNPEASWTRLGVDRQRWASP